MNVLGIWRQRLGKLYLDWAEKIPRFQGGFVAHFQELREIQNRNARHAHAETRFPEAINIEPTRIRFAEVFHLEDLSALKNGLGKAFPTINEEDGREEGIGDIVEFATDLNSAGGRTIGLMVKDNVPRPLVFGGSHISPQELPQCVNSIEVQMHKFLSSSIILTFDVHVGPQLMERIRHLHNQHYLGEINFRSFFPWKIFTAGYSVSTAEVSMEKAVSGAILSVERDVEKFLSQFFKGHFLRHKSKHLRRMPVIEVFKMTGLAAPGRDSFRNLIRERLRWWVSLGFNPPGAIYTDNEIAIISASQKKSCAAQIGYRMVVFNEVQALVPTLGSVTKSLIPMVTTIEVLELITHNTERLRMLAFQKMAPASVNRWFLGRTIKLNNIAQWESIKLDRLVRDLNQESWWVDYATADLERFTQLEGQPQAGENLKASTTSYIKCNSKNLEQHLSLIRKFTEGRMTNLNTEVMYRLQLIAIILL